MIKKHRKTFSCISMYNKLVEYTHSFNFKNRHIRYDSITLRGNVDTSIWHKTPIYYIFSLDIKHVGVIPDFTHWLKVLHVS